MLTQNQTQIAPVCAQCKFFDPSRGTCNTRFERWDYDTTVLVRPLVKLNQAACSLYSEAVPF